MGFDSKWFYVDLERVAGGDGPLEAAELEPFRVALPARNDLGFWTAFSGVSFLAFQSLESRTGIRAADRKGLFAHLAERGELELGVRLTHRSVGALSGLSTVMNVSAIQSKERQKVRKLLGRGSLPKSWRVMSVARLAWFPAYQAVLRAELATNPEAVAEAERVIPLDEFRGFLDLMRDRPAGRVVLVSDTR